MDTVRSFEWLDASELNPALNHLPLWLLDIDGVLNAFDHPMMHSWFNRARFNKSSLSADAFQDLEQFSVKTSGGSEFQFISSLELMADLVRLHDSGFVEIAWLTTWQHDAVSEVAPLFGLPHFPVAATQYGDDPWWKTHAGIEAIQLGRPIIWTDDDAITRKAARLFSESDIDHLLIQPNPNVALTRKHIAVIEEFLTDL